MRISDWSSDVCSSDRRARGILCHHGTAGSSQVFGTDCAVAAHSRKDYRQHMPVVGSGETAQHRINRGHAAARRRFVADHRKGTVPLPLDRHVAHAAGNHDLTRPDFGTIARYLRRAARYSLDLARSEENTSELQSLMRISYAVFCLKKKKMIT